MRGLRRSLPVLLAAVLLAACAPSQPERVPVRKQERKIPSYSIEDFLATTNYGGASFSPDKTKVLVSSDQTGVYNVYAIPTQGGEPVALTSSTTESYLSRGYFPDDERFLYTADQGGNELNHIYVKQLDGSVQDLTPGEKVKANVLGWAQDGQSFYISTNERNEKFFDIYEYATDGYEREMLYKDDTGYQFADISNDERYIAFVKATTTSDTDVYLYDRTSKKMKHITPHEGQVANAAQAFSPDSAALFYTSDQDREFASLFRYDIAGGESTAVVEPDWDVLYAYFSRNGKYLVVGVNNDARTDIHLYDAQSMKTIKMPSLPSADITQVSISRDESMMAFYASTSRNPRDVYVYNLAEGGEPVRLTDSLSKKIDARDLVEAKVVRFNSYDGVEIPGILYKPHQASAESKAPALVWVHGGPGGQSRVGYSALLQYLVNHGYVVYAINNRGSSGYGKTFFKMDDQKHGEADLGDCVASKQMLIASGYVDPERIGILGGSYGGYMVLAAATLAPTEFAVGVDLFGISNWVRTLESIPPYWESFREALYQEMGNPETDKERLTRISPLFNADKIVRPLMVLQGANDPRVIKVESDDIVEAARAKGVPVEYVVFDDEGHGFRKKENQHRGYKAILDFLDKYLKGQGEDNETPAAAAYEPAAPEEMDEEPMDSETEDFTDEDESDDAEDSDPNA